MALEISTVGAKVLYCIETTAGSRPTSGYTQIPDVQTAPAISLSVETLDCSNITDEVTRYINGRQDTGGAVELTLNHTDAVITAWETMKTASDTARATSKETWFEYQTKTGAKSFFFKGIPLQLGTNGIEQNAVDTIPASIVITGIDGWDTKSTT